MKEPLLSSGPLVSPAILLSRSHPQWSKAMLAKALKIDPRPRIQTLIKEALAQIQ
jgi:hypothetical protein